ncbi:phosphatase 2C-like domain-containing protein [Dunaliella salina]|uniref:protein-serine/threonine phosphatase n=1 Tax=Dunaliella salina TaxID=3046 RepID=A0ABQ7FTW0_DUNSA|nr:phosphatase 2C-like domain-containing protein [Dunaliella salina]|eukprot:KAF5825869.1 phosphatase 2C-like domain-containing protein [Dunaliella salina]
MGAYLSQPITSKEEFDGRGKSVDFGGSAMQGWRRTMEDSHLARCLENAPGAPPLSLFGVFDGHGGAEVAKFCERYMVDEFLRLREQETDLGAALVKSFHRMDDMLRDSRVNGNLNLSRAIGDLKYKSSNELPAKDQVPD